MKKIFLSLCFLCILFFTGCSTGKAENTKGTEDTGGQTELQAKLMDCPDGFEPASVYCDDEKIYLAGSCSGKDMILEKSFSDETLKTISYDFENETIQNMKKTDNGYLFLTYDESGAYYIKKGNKTGIIEETELEKNNKDMSLYLSISDIDSQGRIYGISNNNEFFIWDEQGKLEKWLKLKHLFNIFSAFSTNGQVFLFGGISSAISHQSAPLSLALCTEHDISLLKNGDELSLKKTDTGIYTDINFQPLVHTCGDGYKELYISNGLDLYWYDTETNEKKNLCNFLDCGINGMQMEQFFALSEKKFFCLEESNSGNYHYEPYIIQESKIAKKDIITLAAFRTGSIMEEITAFNRSSKTIKVQVVDYSQSDQPQQDLHMDIITGNMPDILDLGGLDQETYIQKDILYDLQEMIEQDDEITEEDFLENILELCRIDGHIYYIPSYFDIYFLTGSADAVQGRKSWNLGEFRELYQNLGKDQQVLASPSSLIEQMLYLNLNQFVDIQNARTDFKSKAFTQIMEFPIIGKTLYEDVFQIAEEKKKGNILLDWATISSYGTYERYKQLFPDMQAVGIPCENGTGVYARFNSGKPLMAVMSKSEKKEQAFEFLKYFWTYEYQSHISTGYPSRTDAFEYKMNKEQPGGDGKRIQELAAQVDDVWFSASKRSEIVDIIIEEAQSYFNGDKTLEEVERILENRVNLYLSEKDG